LHRPSGGFADQMDVMSKVSGMQGKNMECKPTGKHSLSHYAYFNIPNLRGVWMEGCDF
jgi:hypothetical protein